ncbi:tyramine oxidase [Bacillus canaveralius]|uniref:Amine oxidase n=1 Tax=Bacillus canaveralius TaxID=1403243 RepID=A0A2N5GGQ0_9BACI|nr:primary-amine oxidase [Bacillus canaveralius]PLR79923.1 tyramine oxidase [Bacillus canaveralius]PLR88432.1 tyramine oxidase [Bacillus canaveralius]RSK58178.1 primary-amine oxidase [Bacillus canaveralius]
MSTPEKVLQRVQHPLEPLSAEEILKAVSILKEKKNLTDSARFEQVGLYEPAKEVVLNFKEGDPISREAFIIVLDSKDSQTYEAVISVTDGEVVSWKHIPGVQPSFLLEEYSELEETVKKHPDFHAALKKRGIESPDLVMVDPWSVGYFGIPEDEGRRLARALCFVRQFPGDNAYAYPLTGLLPVVDLSTMEIVRIEDHGVKPIAPTNALYKPEQNENIQVRTDLKPIEITQPEGPSFEVNGHNIKWQKWDIRIGYTAREGLVLHTVSYEDKGKKRPVLYRAALSEMVVPYGDTNPAHDWQCAFDAGEYGIGQLANSLELGCDCLGHIQYFDATMATGNGGIHKIPNAICLHEEDYGIAWKHTDWRTNDVEVRRSRRLVISFFTTVANYDYGFFWYFYTDGRIEHEAKLTGILNVGAIDEGVKPKYGSEVAPQINAPIHQHFFNYRIDTQIDGQKNSVQELNTVASKPDSNNPNLNGFYAETTTFKTELEAQRTMNLATARGWKIINPNSKNLVDEPVGYDLVPGHNCVPYLHDESSVIKRAGFIKNHLHVTKFDRDQMYASGKYPNQNKGGDTLEHWVKANRSIENEDIVVWYNMGVHHIVRPEDWPVMPTAYIGFELKPHGFFDRNPALDLPRPTKGTSCCNK